MNDNNNTPMIYNKDGEVISMDNNDNGSMWLNNTFFKTAIAIILLTVGAWGKWVTTTVIETTSDAARNSERLARIEQLLIDHFRSDDAQRHNP